jgi:plastocyanin
LARVPWQNSWSVLVAARGGKLAWIGLAFVIGCSAFVPDNGPLRSTGDGGATGDAVTGDAVTGDAVTGDAVTGDAATGDDAAADSPPDDAVDAAAVPDTSAPTTWTVAVGPKGNHVFMPSALTVHVGDTVHWVWQDSDHTVTSGTVDSADGAFCSPSDVNCGSGVTSGGGATYDHTFATAGTFPYFCQVHGSRGMTGTIRVQ